MIFKKGWSWRQRRLHKQLYLEYRKKEVLWYLDLFLSVSHPEWAVNGFLDDFVNNNKTLRHIFRMPLVCGGIIGYHPAIVNQSDLNNYMGWMLQRQYIKVTSDMYFSDIMSLPRVFELTIDERLALKNKLLNIKE